jgi:NAD(P)-dependent dehydrogenase (short-subunit alcohol dehydrogenase family)
MSESSTPGRERDPREGPKPPFPEQEQQAPGSDAGLRPQADHGEQSYRGCGRLEGLAAIVTGGDSGIGRAVAIAFAREGADVLISYLDEHDDARTTAALVESAGRRAIAVAGDISELAHCGRIVDRAVSEFGRLDVVVNNAATQSLHASFTDITDAEVARIFRTNVFPVFALCRAAIPHLGPGGAIVNSVSIQAFDPSPALLHYAASKGALVTFTKGLSKELIEQGIRVNAVAPGPVWTPLIASTTSPETAASFGEDNPTGRPAQPAELAPAYVFLASADARFITGEVLGVTGGRLLT